MLKSIRFGVSALVLSLGASLASAATVETDEYVLTYNDDTVLGGINSWSSGGSDTLKNLSFQWLISSDVNVVSTGDPSMRQFNLPTFSIMAKPGWALSDLGGFLGNLTFVAYGAGAELGVEVSGAIQVNGGPAVPLSGFLTQTVTNSDPDFAVGYFGSTDSVSGSFDTFSFSGGTLTLTADAAAGGFASIVGQPQNVLQVSFIAAAVPEPGTWAMMVAGVGLMGGVVARRRQRG